MFLTDRATLLTKDHLSKPSICSLLAMEIIYFLNCPQLLLEPCLEAVTNPTFIPLRYFIQGRLHEDLKETKDAIQCYREAIRMGDQLCTSKNGFVSCGEHVPAFASYELAVLLCKSKLTFDEGKEFFAKSGDGYKACHFRNRLHVKIHLAKKAFGES
ncbi:hypothetical protein BV898_12282 [Hypsibius exemplaris]|uniref:Uncharacterized protein n=1 Tax=Hypsibius exemplaris TaxID=2072580 RepID=A0A1W0WED3_HYPEX|nr:hypothetical protein BV898_12282 [Hypsibius exemplaris]